jgi:hypothetical protein
MKSVLKIDCRYDYAPTNAPIPPPTLPTGYYATTGYPTTVKATSKTVLAPWSPPSVPYTTVAPKTQPSPQQYSQPTRAPAKSPTKPPFVSSTKALSKDLRQCEQNAACAAHGFTGQCCPTIDNWTLVCCGDGPIEELCQGNSKCAALELTGACCPTVEDIFLDVATSVWRVTAVMARNVSVSRPWNTNWN